MPSKNGTKPRIITLTVQRLRELALDMEQVRLVKIYTNPHGQHSVWLEADTTRLTAHQLRQWADELDAYDARETRLDPSKRRKATRAKR